MAEPQSHPPANPVDDYRSRPLCRPYRPPAPPPLWRDAPQALIAGLLAAQGLPPTHWWWLAPLAIGWLLWLLDAHLRAVQTPRARAGRAAMLLFAFGLGWHVSGVWWITEAFQVDAERYAALGPFAVGLLAAAMATFYAAGGALLGWWWRPGWWCRANAAALAALIVLADLGRGQPLAFGGFPWNPFATVLDAAHLLPLMQAAQLFGIWGFSALLLWLAALPVQLLLGLLHRCPRAVLLQALAGALLLAGLWIWGQARLNAHASATVAADAPWVVIVQPSVDQREKWKPANRQSIFDGLLQLTRQGLAQVQAQCTTARACDAPVIVVWPESAVPFLLDISPRALRMIADTLPANAWLLTGALRQLQPQQRRPGDPRRLFNAILAIDTEGRVRLRYDKRRLVPFGEYVPLARLLQPLGVRQLVPFRHGFIPGRDMGPHLAGNLPPFEAFICYEVIYHDRPARWRRTRWLLNVTNDAWFGLSAGPHQHLQQARYHAIIRGLPLVRAANSGISAVFDARGRALARLQLMRRGVLVQRLPLMQR